MAKRLLSKCKYNLNVKNCVLPAIQRRCIFSPAYSCDAEWENRKTSSVLKDVNSYEFINTLLVRAQAGQTTSAIDLNIATHCVSSEDQLADVEELLYKFRHSRNSVSMLSSSHHAVIRAYLQFNRTDKIMEFLADTINYGIFPDWHAANLLMDHFLEAGNTKDAARVSCFMMQQEDFAIRSTRWLMLYSCLKWLKEADPKETWTPDEQQEDDDEEIVFRLPFLRNRYCDDHFDLVDPKQLVGKTLLWTADYCLKMEKAAEPSILNLFVNAKLRGLALRRDVENLGKFVDSAQSATNLSINKDTIECLRNLNAEDENKEVKNNEAQQQTEAETDNKGGLEQSERFTECEQKIHKYLDTQEASGKILDSNLIDDFEKAFKANLASFETEDVERQRKTYEHWNATRETKINNQINRYLKTERLKLVEQEMESLKRENQHMFFFENKEELEKTLPQPAPPAQPSEEDFALKKREVRISRKQLRKLARQKQVAVPSDDDYVVPELRRSARQKSQDVKY